MYHPLTPGQSWVQSPVSFRRKGGREESWRKRGRNIAEDCGMWTDMEDRMRNDVEKIFRETESGEKEINK